MIALVFGLMSGSVAWVIDKGYKNTLMEQQAVSQQHRPGIDLKNESDKNDIKNNQFVDQPGAKITLDHSSGNIVAGNVWSPSSTSTDAQNKYDGMTNTQLIAATSKITKGLRIFDKRISSKQESLLRERKMKELAAQSEEDNRYFQDHFLNDCRSVNSTLDGRVQNKDSDSVRFALVGTTLRSGMLGGPSPVRNLADYLDFRATQLHKLPKQQ